MKIFQYLYVMIRCWWNVPVDITKR